VTVTWVAGDPVAAPQVAYAVGRWAGGAVVRNRIRRRLRAILRELGPELPSGCYLIGAGPEAATLPYGELRTTVSEAVRAATASRCAS
jgi:ribonuclease P protein component